MANWQQYTLAASAARTDTTGTNGTTIPVDPFDYALLVFEQTNAATDVGDTCDVYVDVSPDGGTSWVNAVHFTQRLGNGTDAQTDFAVLHSNAPGTDIVVATADASAAKVRPTVRGNAMRARWVIADSGTDNATFTFSVKAYLQNG